MELRQKLLLSSALGVLRGLRLRFAAVAILMHPFVPTRIRPLPANR
jgi:hypothetical protein